MATMAAEIAALPVKLYFSLKAVNYEFARIGFAEDAMTPSRKPVALVTGANKGIGFEVARAIAKSGYVVLLGARNPTTGREAAGMLTSDHLDVRFVELDVTRMETISA